MIICPSRVRGRARVSTKQYKTKQNNINYSSSNNNLNKEREENACANSLFECFMNEKKKWRENLLENTEWVDSVVSYSKKGEEIAGSIPAALDCFDQYNTLSRNSIGICCEADYANKFLGFWRHNNFTTDMEELARKGSKRWPRHRRILFLHRIPPTTMVIPPGQIPTHKHNHCHERRFSTCGRDSMARNCRDK